jgi:hypothetical protein
MYDVNEFLSLCRSDPDEALLRISKVIKNVPGMRGSYVVPLFKFLALGQKALNLDESKADVADAEAKTFCEESLSEYLLAWEAGKSQGGESVLKELEPALREVAILLEKCAPGRPQELLGKRVDNIAALLAQGQTLELSMHHTTLGDLFQDNELTVRGNFSDEQLGLLREVRYVELTAPFRIRSACVFFIQSPTSVQEIRGFLYDRVLQSDRVPPINGKHCSFVLAKDLREKAPGEPVEPRTYGRWVFYSSEEYERVEAEVRAAAKASEKSSCFIATAVFGEKSSPQVVALRTFRDERLLSSSLGRSAVDLYYRLSPAIAARIQDSPALKAITRGLLGLLIHCLPHPKM